MKKINKLHPSGSLKTILTLISFTAFFFGAGNSLNAQQVTGPDLVCTTAQYTINCGCTPTWSSSSNLTLVSGQGTYTATFSANGSGLATVTATWCGGSYSDIKDDIWVGPPTAPIFVTNEAYFWGYSGTWISDFTVYPYTTLAEQSAWSNIYGGDDSYYFGQNYWQLYFTYEGLYQIWATNENTCGESDAVNMYYLGPRSGIEFGYDVFDE